MSRYMLFNPAFNYTDEYGEPCSFEEHLDYLRVHAGTPDFWASFDTLTAAVNAAQDRGIPMAIVDEMRDYDIIAIEGENS